MVSKSSSVFKQRILEEYWLSRFSSYLWYGSRLWEKEEDIKISGNNRKKLSIRIYVDFYEVCPSYIIYCLHFLFYDYTNTLFFTHHICGIYLTREKDFRKYWQKLFELEEDKATNLWWRENLLIYGFNEACKNIYASSLKVGDESTSAISFRKTGKRGINSLVLYFPQSRATRDRVQYSHLLCYRGIDMN